MAKEIRPPTRASSFRRSQQRMGDVDRAFYDGVFAHRIFAGGLARRLGAEVPAALVTGRMAEQWDASSNTGDLVYPDIEVISRYIVQILTHVETIARRNNWDVQTGLHNQPFIIPVNDETASQIIEAIVKANFYGISARKFSICFTARWAAVDGI